MKINRILIISLTAVLSSCSFFMPHFEDISEETSSSFESSLINSEESIIESSISEHSSSEEISISGSSEIEISSEEVSSESSEIEESSEEVTSESSEIFDYYDWPEEIAIAMHDTFNEVIPAYYTLTPEYQFRSFGKFRHQIIQEHPVMSTEEYASALMSMEMHDWIFDSGNNTLTKYDYDENGITYLLTYSFMSYKATAQSEDTTVEINFSREKYEVNICYTSFPRYVTEMMQTELLSELPCLGGTFSIDDSEFTSSTNYVCFDSTRFIYSSVYKYRYFLRNGLGFTSTSNGSNIVTKTLSDVTYFGFTPTLHVRVTTYFDDNNVEHFKVEGWLSLENIVFTEFPTELFNSFINAKGGLNLDAGMVRGLFAENNNETYSYDVNHFQINSGSSTSEVLNSLNNLLTSLDFVIRSNDVYKTVTTQNPETGEIIKTEELTTTEGYFEHIAGVYFGTYSYDYTSNTFTLNIENTMKAKYSSKVFPQDVFASFKSYFPTFDLESSDRSYGYSYDGNDNSYSLKVSIIVSDDSIYNNYLSIMDAKGYEYSDEYVALYGETARKYMVDNYSVIFYMKNNSFNVIYSMNKGGYASIDFTQDLTELVSDKTSEHISFSISNNIDIIIYKNVSNIAIGNNSRPNFTNYIYGLNTGLRFYVGYRMAIVSRVGALNAVKINHVSESNFGNYLEEINCSKEIIGASLLLEPYFGERSLSISTSKQGRFKTIEFFY